MLDGGTVTIMLSLGKERYDVPKLRGMTEDEAQDALTGGQPRLRHDHREVLRDGRRRASSSQLAKAGTTLRPDAPVDLVVSKGPRPVKLQDWVGKDADDAMAWFKAKGLEGKVAGEEYSDDASTRAT